MAGKEIEHMEPTHHVFQPVENRSADPVLDGDPARPSLVLKLLEDGRGPDGAEALMLTCSAWRTASRLFIKR